MIVIVKKDFDLSSLQSRLERMGLQATSKESDNVRILYVDGKTAGVDIDRLRSFEGVIDVVGSIDAYPLCSRTDDRNDSVIDVGGVKIGGDNFCVIAGPCAVESERQTIDIAFSLKKSGANILRGGAFKPRTSPYSFQGLGIEGLRILKKAKKESGLPIVSEIVSPEYIGEYDDVDIIQVGARNMQNFELLKKLGKISTPILLKRGMGASVDEWLSSAEYIMSGGNKNVILCERGIRTFQNGMRNTLDVGVIPIIKEKTHLPVIVDPSHAGGVSRFVKPLALAATAVGVHGLMIEVHDDPERALSDGEQALKIRDFELLMKDINGIMPVIGKR